MDVTHSMHTSEGLAFIAGPNVPHGEIIDRHDIMDLNATFYRLLGEEVPKHVEGRPIDMTRASTASVFSPPPPAARQNER
jgi:arylsulfatase A-like enzyme